MSDISGLFDLAHILDRRALSNEERVTVSKTVRRCAENWEAQRDELIALRRTLNATYDNAPTEAYAAAQRDAERVASVVQPDRYVVKQAFGSFYVKDLHEMTSVATCAFEALADAYCAALNAAARKAAP